MKHEYLLAIALSFSVYACGGSSGEDSVKLSSGFEKLALDPYAEEEEKDSFTLPDTNDRYNVALVNSSDWLIIGDTLIYQIDYARGLFFTRQGGVEALAGIEYEGDFTAPNVNTVYDSYYSIDVATLKKPLPSFPAGNPETWSAAERKQFIKAIDAAFENGDIIPYQVEEKEIQLTFDPASGTLTGRDGTTLEVNGVVNGVDVTGSVESNLLDGSASLRGLIDDDFTAGVFVGDDEDTALAGSFEGEPQ